jgi:hypothetical protein
MRLLYIFLLLLFTLSSFGQNLYYDFKRDEFPDLGIRCFDSINSIKVYKSEAFFTSKPKTPKSKGNLLYHLILDENHKESGIYNYNTSFGNIEAKYIYDYSSDNIVKITMLSENDKINHQWVLNNERLTEELRYNLRQELTDKWTYSYIHDTLIVVITKHNKQDNLLYELKYEYDSLNRLIEKREYKNGSLVDIRKMIYEPSGKLIRVKFYPPGVMTWSSGEKIHVVNTTISGENDLPYHFIEFRYDSIDRIVKKTTMNNDSVIEFYETYSYGPHGKLNGITEYNKNDKPQRKQAFEYNESGRKTGYAIFERTIGKKLQPVFESKIIENQSGNIEVVEFIYNYTYNRKTVLYTYEYQ